MEYRFNNYLKIIVKNLAFPLKDVLKETCKEMSIKHILNKTLDGQYVSVKAKAMFKGETEVFCSAQNKDLKKSDVIIADHTGAVLVTI